MVTARVRYPNNSVSPQIVAEGWRARGGELPCCGWLSACGAGISNVDFVAVCGRAPHGMICLNSALAYWDLSDEIPAQVHLAVPSGSHRPVIDYLRNCPACAPMAQGQNDSAARQPCRRRPCIILHHGRRTVALVRNPRSAVAEAGAAAGQHSLQRPVPGPPLVP